MLQAYKKFFTKKQLDKRLPSARHVAQKRLEELQEKAKRGVANVTSSSSTGEAADIARRMGVKFAVYDDLSLEVANSVNAALMTLPEEAMPLSVSSARNLQKAVNRKFGKLKDYHGVTVRMNSTVDFRKITGDAGMFDLDGGVVLGVNIPKSKGLAGIAERKAAFNREYFKKTGRKWYFNESGETVAYHEVGHAYEKYYGLPRGFEDAAKKWAADSGFDMLKDPHEAWAEAWAAYHTGANKLPAEIEKFIREASKRPVSASSSAERVALDGAKRVALHSHGWAEHSVSDVLERLVPGAKRIEKNSTGKVRYVSDETSLQLIVDEENEYFRIIDSAAGRGKQSYVGIDGKPLDCDKISGDEYERLTHFRLRK